MVQKPRVRNEIVCGGGLIWVKEINALDAVKSIGEHLEGAAPVERKEMHAVPQRSPNDQENHFRRRMYAACGI